MKQYLIQTPKIYSDNDNGYHWKNYRTYSEYNYLNPGFISWIKKWHFRVSLNLTSKYFYKANVIDFGCADGFFIPSLAKYFNHVTCIDRNEKSLAIANKIIDTLSIPNAEIISNNNLEIDDLRKKISKKKYQIIFLLEVLEHIGTDTDMYKSEIAFLDELSTLITNDGIIVLSVPVMVGIPFLIQRIALSVFGMYREPISLNDIIKAGIFNDASNLESNRTGGHLGFNHKKLENYLKDKYKIVTKKSNMFGMIYVIKKQGDINR